MAEHGHRHYDEAMLSVEDALERILSSFHVLEPEDNKPILEAIGQVLAEDVVSGFDIPPLDNSAMDGYAVKARDLKGASPESPVLLTVIGAVAAGQLPDRAVAGGTAIRIMTPSSPSKRRTRSHDEHREPGSPRSRSIPRSRPAPTFGPQLKTSAKASSCWRGGRSSGRRR